MRGQMTSHMENENENRNKYSSSILSKGGYKGGIEKKKSANFLDLELGRAYFTEDGTVWQELGDEQKRLLQEKKIQYYEIFKGEIY